MMDELYGPRKNLIYLDLTVRLVLCGFKLDQILYAKIELQL